MGSGLLVGKLLCENNEVLSLDVEVSQQNDWQRDSKIAGGLADGQQKCSAGHEISVGSNRGPSCPGTSSRASGGVMERNKEWLYVQSWSQRLAPIAFRPQIEYWHLEETTMLALYRSTQPHIRVCVCRRARQGVQSKTYLGKGSPPTPDSHS